MQLNQFQHYGWDEQEAYSVDIIIAVDCTEQCMPMVTNQLEILALGL
jgi:hypothetical protein